METVQELIKVKPSQFLDYKEYLSALFQFGKNTNPNYSYVRFSAEIGLGQGNVAWLIVNDQRRITNNTMYKIIEALELKGYERQYFQTLVAYTNAKEPKKIDALLQKLVYLKSRCLENTTDEQVLKFYSHWYHAIIFEMVGMQKFSSDPEWIRKKLNFSLSEKEVLGSLKVLEDLGLIAFDTEKGRHIKLKKDFETASEVQVLGVMQFHKKMIELGKASIDQLPREQRDIGAVTLAVTPEGRLLIKQEVQAFRRYLMFLGSQFVEPSEIVQVNIQAFTLTQDLNPETGDSSDET